MADTPAQDRKLGLSRTRVGGRFVTSYTPELALRIVERIANGETLKAICAADGSMPNRSTLHRWVLLYPDLDKAYVSAREVSAHGFEDEAIDLARSINAKTLKSAQDVRAADIAMNQFRWSAQRRNPRDYGERRAGQMVVPIQINTSLDLGQGGVKTETVAHVYSLSAKVEGEDKEGPKPLVKIEAKETKSD